MGHVLRTIGRWVIVVAFTLAALTVVAVIWLLDQVRLETAGELDFATELAVPPLLEPTTEPDGTKVFDLDLQAGRSELLPGTSTDTWGANGSYLGPTLRARRGDDVRVRVTNALPEATTLHWHGMHLPGAMDGGPHQMIRPGGVWEPAWRIDQPAATLWYHPHPHHRTAEHVYRGIAGLFILDDDEADSLPLPATYGVDDIPLIIQDKRLRDDGELDFSPGVISPTGRLGSTILVNGTHSPHLQIGDDRVRFRLLNASDARVYNVGFADDRRFDLIATEGGLLETPRRMTRIQLSPGERAEIVAAFGAGERIVLRSFEPDLETNFWENRFAGGDDSFDLLEIHAATKLASSPEVPDTLGGRERHDREDVTRTRSFELSGQSNINGREMDMSRIDEVVPPGTTEIWVVRNASGTPHNFHVHGVSFAVLDYAGRDPPPHLRGLKDTTYVPPGEAVTMLVRFPHYPDPESPYMFHCHILQHEDRGMMGQFTLSAPPR
jgi:suppressor of ftsI